MNRTKSLRKCEQFLCLEISKEIIFIKTKHDSEMPSEIFSFINFAQTKF